MFTGIGQVYHYMYDFYSTVVRRSRNRSLASVRHIGVNCLSGYLVFCVVQRPSRGALSVGL